MPTETASRLQERAQAFRDALEASNQGAADRMARGWAAGLQRVELEVQSLMAKMEAARLAGVKVSPAWLYQERRLAALVDQMSDELARWAPLAEETIRRNAYAAAASAQDQAKSLAREAASVGLPGVEASFTDLSPENMASILGHLAPGGPLRDLLGSLSLGAVQAAEDAILQGVILGKGSAWITRNLAKALDVPRWRAETIARTEALRAYRETSRLTYQKSNVVGTWIWTAALDRRTCPACLALHGEEFSLEENLDGHPRCRCAMVPQTLSWADINPALADLPDTRPTVESGADWLKRQGPATQKAVLGPGKYALYQKGTPLGDFVARTRSPEWGTMRRERSLLELKQGRNANYRDVPQASAPPTPPTGPRQVGPDDWDRWDQGRANHVHAGGTASDIADATVNRDRLRQYARDDAAQLADFRQLVKDRQAELRSFVPDAKERAKVSRTDYTLKARKDNVRHLEAKAAQSAKDLADAEARLAQLTNANLPDFNPANPLEFYGDRITTYDRSAPTGRWLGDLEEHISPDHHRILRDHFAGTAQGGFYLGARYVPDLDDLGHLRGHQPRGWAQGRTFDQVAGVYSPVARVCACGHDSHGSGAYHSTVLHEGGHALDDAYGRNGQSASERQDYRDAYAAVPSSVSDNWNPYYRPGGNPTGHHSEAWAEGFMGWTKARRGTRRDQARSIARALLGVDTPSTAQVDAHLGLADYYSSLPKRP